jgi:tRNA(Ile)-lysidine synthetase-like protein
VAAFADLLRDEAQLLAPLVDAAWERAWDGRGLRADALSVEHVAMRRLLVRRLLAEAGAPGEAMGAGPLVRALGLLDGGRRAQLPGGVWVAVERGRLVVVGPASPAPGAVALEVPGRAVFGALAVRASEGEGCDPGPRRVAVRAGGALAVRAPRPGDRLPLAGGGRRAVGRVLADAGVPARLRPQVPVVATPERVVWVAGHRAADDLLAPSGAPAVVLELEPA